MKYVNKFSVIIGAIFLVKIIFLNDYIYLGLIDEYYGVTAIILLLLLIISEIYLRKQNKKK